MKRLVAFALAAACSRAPEPAATAPHPDQFSATGEGPRGEGADTATPSATSTSAAPEGPVRAEPVEARTAPGAPLDLPVSVATATASGREQPLARGATTVVELEARFRVEVAVPLQDGRLSLLDEAGAMVPAAGGAEIGASWARFTLLPEAQLVPGTAYALRLDGAVRRGAHDPQGREYEPAAWPLRAAGERPRAEPAPKKRRR